MRCGLFLTGLSLAVICASVNALSVTCNTETVDITIEGDDRTDLALDQFTSTATAIRTARVTSTEYSTYDSNCRKDAGTNTYTIGLTECSPVISQSGDVITYVWTLWKVVREDIDMAAQIVARFGQASIEFRCEYEATAEVEASFLPTIAVSQYSTSAQGTFSFTMTLYSDSARMSDVGNTAVQVPELIYGRITLVMTTIGTLTAQVKKCFASDSSDPAATPTDGEYTFIDEFCPQRGESTDPTDVATVSVQGVGADADFNFRSFVYTSQIDTPSVVYIHCIARACDTGSGSCAGPSCTPITKRSVGDDMNDNTQMVTYGPIVMQPQPRTCDVDNGRCDDVCTMVGDKAVCSCGGGRTLAENGRSCVEEIRLDLDVQQHESLLYVDATKVVGLVILLLAAIFATVLITLSCKRGDKGKSAFQGV